MENWLGQNQIKVDDKGRLSFPNHATELFPAKELVLSVHVYQKKAFLEVLTLSEWELKLKKIDEQPVNNPKARAYKRFLLSGSAKLSLDKQNRLIIPSFQREMIGLKNEAVMVNLENKLELWSKENWKATSEDFIENFEILENWVNEPVSEIEAGEEQGGLNEFKPAA